MDEVQVARVAVDMPLPHLDRLFDYAIPEGLREHAVVGARVRVRFAHRLRDGFIVEIAASSERSGDLAPLEKVVSAEPVLTAEVARLARLVADHYAGTFADVARLAVPPRHAATEKAVRPDYPAPHLGPGEGPLAHFPDGEGYLNALRQGASPRAVWNPVAVYGSMGDWCAGIVQAVEATLSSDRGAVVVVPDHRDLALLKAACTAQFGKGSFVTLTAETGPAARYRAFLAAERGQVRLVIGTRAAIWAPVTNLGLIALVDDGDDLLAEPRAPYPHVREVGALRASLSGCGMLIASYGVTADVQALTDKGWLRPIRATPMQARHAAPAVRVAADHDAALARDPLARSARLPHDAFAVVRAGLASGPVLVQVPRAGYLAALVCHDCRTAARCPTCAHVLSAPRSQGGAVPTCPSCGPVPGWQCRACSGRRWRAPVVGVERTAEELGKAFPNTPIVQSSGTHVLTEVGEKPQLVLATPGAEPRAAFGYAAAILLDTGHLMSRPDLRAGEEALRRWLAVSALVRPASDGGTVLAVGDPSARPLQALVRMDPGAFAALELQERGEAGFPPAWKWITLEGGQSAIVDATEQFSTLPGVEVFGPVEAGDGETFRLALRAPLSEGKSVVASVKAFLAARSARKSPGHVRVRVDPQMIG